MLPVLTIAQVEIGLNAWVDAEVSYGQKDAHFYYNQVHKDFLPWRVGVSDLNLVVHTQIDSSFSFLFRGRLFREQEGRFGQLAIPLANIQYAPPSGAWTLSLGRFLIPFGSFVNNQHPRDRPFINLPLSFAYYFDISPKIGFAENMGEPPIVIDEQAQWGSSMLYYRTYTNGLRFDWDIAPDKLAWSVALTNASPNVKAEPFRFDNWGLISRLQYQPAYFWQQGLSLSWGSFHSSSSLDDNLPAPLRQILVGTDWLTGFGFWEISGELIGAWYKTPLYQPESNEFTPPEGWLSALSGAVRLKYEFPSISGLYAAYGLEWLTFGDIRDAGYGPVGAHWNERVLRHNFGLGYTLTHYALIRLNFLTQEVADHPAWEQNTWRSVLTVFF